MFASDYCPQRGDVIWISFNPQFGPRAYARRPALVLSPEAYNRRTGLVLLCPITRLVKGYPFEVHIPEGLRATGVVLADQTKSLDWKARKASLLCTLPAATVREVLGKVGTLLDA